MTTLIACQPSSKQMAIAQTSIAEPFDTSATIVHVFVALCDNEHQGIVPVPKAIGNGKDYRNNLYWGCKYGVHTYFKNSKDWVLLQSFGVNDTILQRSVFKHKSSNTFLVADAYNGEKIKLCTQDFLASCAGMQPHTLQVVKNNIGINGNANILAYVGHDGLMDFSINQQYKAVDKKSRKAMMLACVSKTYFASHLAATNAEPILWSTGLMSPEAYTLHDALNAYLTAKNKQNAQQAAAKAYAKFQKCSISAAGRLLICN
jgi:hypothetical protein